MANEKLKKFIAFEWLMFWVVGLLWAASISLMLSLSNAFRHKELLSRHILYMFTPYGIYLAGRFIYLVYRSLLWAYLTSNFFFTSTWQKIVAEEWFRFVAFVLVWGMIMALPMYWAGMFTDNTSWGWIILVLLGPYAGYWVWRWLGMLVNSWGWALRITARK